MLCSASGQSAIDSGTETVAQQTHTHTCGEEKKKISKRSEIENAQRYTK